MTSRRSLSLDLLLVALFAICVRSAHGQAISWSHAVTATTTLTVGVRLDPTSSRWIDSRLRPLSPYRNERRPNGAFVLPDYRLTAHTCDVQHLGWLGIGNWSGPRIMTQAIWLPAGYLGARLTNAPLSLAAMNGFTLTRTAVVPGYHLDPLGYSASVWSWGTAGALLGSHRLTWRATLALSALWAVAAPWATPWPLNECES